MKEQQFIRDILKRGNYESFNVNVVAELIQQLVEVNREFTHSMAELDLMVSAYKGSIKSFRYYAKRWGWSEGKARQYFIKIGINSKPESWQVSPEKRQKSTTHPTTQVQHSHNTKTGDISQNSQEYNTHTTQVQHTLQHGIINKEDRESITRARVREIPTLEEVFEYCDFMSIKHEVGESFFDHYQSVGWLNGLGIEIKDWKAALRKSNSRVRSQPSGANHGTSITKTTAPSTNTRRQAITDDEFAQRTNAARQLVAAEMARRVAAESTTDT